MTGGVALCSSSDEAFHLVEKLVKEGEGFVDGLWCAHIHTGDFQKAYGVGRRAGGQYGDRHTVSECTKGLLL